MKFAYLNLALVSVLILETKDYNFSIVNTKFRINLFYFQNLH